METVVSGEAPGHKIFARSVEPVDRTRNIDPR